ncbi:hypothetical protein QQF64_031504 [Cirrhinus molitorella]|uniref:Uncharacterized protein n=1 Tax=Cirrhinus molitorella TaxID=172907 RepID=A0ABR3MXB4_9TELE
MHEGLKQWIQRDVREEVRDTRVEEEEEEVEVEVENVVKKEGEEEDEEVEDVVKKEGEEEDVVEEEEEEEVEEEEEEEEEVEDVVKKEGEEEDVVEEEEEEEVEEEEEEEEEVEDVVKKEGEEEDVVKEEEEKEEEKEEVEEEEDEEDDDNKEGEEQGQGDKQTFREENRTQRRPPGGGRLRLLSEEQERELVNMVIANNVIRLREIQRRVIEDDHHFRGINAISLSTIDRILRKNQFRMKQVYRVPFERNSDRVKNQRVEYVQRMFEIEGRPVPHEIIFVDEAEISEEELVNRILNNINPRVAGCLRGTLNTVEQLVKVGLMVERDCLGAKDYWQKVGSKEKTKKSAERTYNKGLAGMTLAQPHPITSLLDVPIKVNGQKVKAVIDTGSSYTLMQESLWKQLKTKSPPIMTSAPQKFIMADGTIHQSRDLQRIRFQWHDQDCMLDTYILKNTHLAFPIIAGLDFLSATGAVLEVAQGRFDEKFFFEGEGGVRTRGGGGGAKRFGSN